MRAKPARELVFPLTNRALSSNNDLLRHATTLQTWAIAVYIQVCGLVNAMERPNILVVRETGLARHVASQTSSAVRNASDAHLRLRVLVPKMTRWKQMGMGHQI